MGHIQQISQALDRLHLDMSAEELADTLWLALHMQVDPLPKQQGTTTLLGPSHPESAVKQTDTPPSLQEAPRPEHPRPSRPRISERPPRLKRLSQALYTRSTKKLKKHPLARYGHPLKVPDAPPLPEALKIARALRPLLRRTNSHSRFILDEEATVRKVADQGLWLPQLLPAPERNFDLALVIDESASMWLWAGVIMELRRLFEYHGAFANVYTWWLATELPDNSVQLYATPPGRQRERVDPGILIDPQQRRLIVVLSDCVSQGWYSSELINILELWGKLNLVTIMQMLPERLWQRTALALATPILLRARHIGVPSSQLQIKAIPQWFLSEPDQQSAVAVISLESNLIAQWAQTMAGTSNAWIIGRSFNSELLFDHGDESTDLSEIALESLTPQQRVRRFRATASPLAYHLAETMAALPVNLPVVRLAQRTMLPKAGQAHIAEFFLGGLVCQTTANADVHDPNDIEYDFIAGVREELLSAVPIAQPLQVLRRISDYIEGWLGKFLDFQALLANPTAIDDVIIPEHGIQFAEISIRVLRRIGGRYAVLADALERKLRNDPSLPLSSTGFGSEDERQQLREMIFDPNFAYRSDKRERFFDAPISRFSASSILFDLGDGTEGVVPWYEMKTLSDEEFRALKPGDICTVFLYKVATDKSIAILSIDKAQIEKQWRRIKQIQKDKGVVNGIVIGYNNGGLVVRVEGLQGFVPNHAIKELLDIPLPQLSVQKHLLMHHAMQLVIVECKPEQGILILSSRIEEQLLTEQQLDDFFASLQLGQIYEGTITRITHYGILVDIGGAEGVVNKRELDHIYFPDIISRFHVGQRIQVAILKFNSETRKIELSHRQTIPDPWENNTLLEELHAGDIRDSIIVGITKTVIIVNIDGLAGIVPLRELDHSPDGQNLQHYSVGDILPVKVLEIDRSNKRLFLSHKRLIPHPRKAFIASLNIGDIFEGTITNIVNYGVFVNIGEADGFIHIKELDYNYSRTCKPEDFFRVGDPIRVMIIGINNEKSLITLSSKRLLPDPWKDMEMRYNLGNWYIGTITDVVAFGVFLTLEKGIIGLLHKSELPNEIQGSFQKIFQIGQSVNVRIKKIDIEKRRLGLSMRPMQ